MRSHRLGAGGERLTEICITMLSSLIRTQATEVISKLYAAHQGGDKNSGFDNEADGAAVKDVVAAGVLDLYLTKWWGIKLATGAAVTVLRVDQVT